METFQLNDHSLPLFYRTLNRRTHVLVEATINTREGVFAFQLSKMEDIHEKYICYNNHLIDLKYFQEFLCLLILFYIDHIFHYILFYLIKFIFSFNFFSVIFHKINYWL